MRREDYYGRPKGCERKIVLSIIIVVLLGLGMKCHAQEQLTNDQFYLLVTNQFRNHQKEFNYLEAKIDSLEKRITELENNCLRWGKEPSLDQPDFIPLGDPSLYPFDRVMPNQIPIDSVFNQNALIKLGNKPDSIWPGLYRPRIDWKAVGRYKKRPNRP
jgi:cell division protein FtsB